MKSKVKNNHHFKNKELQEAKAEKRRKRRRIRTRERDQTNKLHKIMKLLNSRNDCRHQLLRILLLDIYYAALSYAVN